MFALFEFFEMEAKANKTMDAKYTILICLLLRVRTGLDDCQQSTAGKTPLWIL